MTEFEYTVISFFCKMSCSTTKFRYLSKVRRVTLCIKYSHWHIFYRNSSKVWIHYDLLFSEIVPNKLEQNLDRFLRLEELFFTLRIIIKLCTDFTGIYIIKGLNVISFTIYVECVEEQQIRICYALYDVYVLHSIL